MKRLFACASVAALMVALGSAGTLATPKASSLWSVYNINSGGASYTPKAAPGTSTSVANFDFPSSPTAALLTTTKDKALLGNLTGKTITADFTVTATADAVYAYGGSFCGSSDTFVRLYFTANGGKFAYSNYWWSNPIHYTFVDGATTATVSLNESLATTNWSDWGGEPAASVPAAFATAAAHVTSVGLSFGGGCFFANGVGVSPGSASFTLSHYTLTP